MTSELARMHGPQRCASVEGISADPELNRLGQRCSLDRLLLPSLPSPSPSLSKSPLPPLNLYRTPLTSSAAQRRTTRPPDTTAYLRRYVELEEITISSPDTTHHGRSGALQSHS